MASAFLEMNEDARERIEDLRENEALKKRVTEEGSERLADGASVSKLESVKEPWKAECTQRRRVPRPEKELSSDRSCKRLVLLTRSFQKRSRRGARALPR